MHSLKQGCKFQNEGGAKLKGVQNFVGKIWRRLNLLTVRLIFLLLARIVQIPHVF